MAFFDNVRGKLNQASQTTVQKAKELSEIAKLNAAIASTERQINELYSKLGYEVYCAYNEAPLPEVESLINQLKELHQNIENCRAQIKEINAVETCPHCGARITKEMIFCSGCGNRLIVPQPEPLVVEENVQEVLLCGACGAELAPDSIFCTNCGNKVG